MPKPTLPALPANANVERILTEAWQLFQLRGYQGTAMGEVCQRCGITKPTLYYYFGNKEGLYAQVMLRQLQGYGPILARPSALAERLTVLATHMLEQFSSEISTMFNDMRHLRSQRHVRLLNTAFEHELLGPLTATFQAEIAQHVLRPAPAAFYAWAFLGLVSTFTAQARRTQSPPALATQLVTLFLAGATHPEK